METVPFDGTKVKVGMKVISILHGVGEVRQITDHWIAVSFHPVFSYIMFRPDGKLAQEHVFPCLFRMEKEKKQIKKWVVIVRAGNGYGLRGPMNSLEAAKKWHNIVDIAEINFKD